MKVLETEIEDLKIIIPEIFEDSRGYFFESYNKKKFIENNLIYDFVQDNQSESKYGTVRGLHFQINPFAQAKLVRVLQGKILDVALDLRSEKQSFGKYVAVELSKDNHKQLLIPRGFAHGFSVLSETAVVLYKIDNIYMHEYERSIKFDDKDLSIDWKIKKSEFIISEKDMLNENFNKSDIYFK